MHLCCFVSLEFQVSLDIVHHTTMLELHQRVSPSEIILGWYATASNFQIFPHKQPTEVLRLTQLRICDLGLQVCNWVRNVQQ
jgi:hypothetical protein